MRKILLIFTFIFALQNLFAAETGFERVLTQESSIQTALAINHDVLIQAQNVEFAKQRINESSALYFPRIDFNFNASGFDNTSPIILSGDFAPTPVFLPDTNRSLYYVTRVSAWQTIYAGGRNRATNKLAIINLDKVKNEENLIKFQVTGKVKTIFNDCLYYKEKLKLYKSATSGLTPKERAAKISIAQFNYDKALINLLAAIGLDLDTLADVSGVFKAKIKEVTLNQCLLLAYQFKPEMQITQNQEIMDDLGVNLLSMQRYPTISIGAAQEWTGEKIVGEGVNSNWYISANVNIPLFDGGAMFARAKQGKINLRASTLKRSKIEEAVRLAVNKAFLEYNFWKKQAAEQKLIDKTEKFSEAELDIIDNLNKSYYTLELAVGVQLDSY
ncbi:TolC family protein [Endomicrobium proavitum]|uniref:Outer membrane efflux protein n=1 Tax=Endomicrobium proavitum TaxID=1408281 RepID=A0A0G3WJT6_9BACT|nr:TolC family protein [Endomicrobium proavitum]AKL98145.1 exported protein of unknown function [Endomicrobium proavitum]